MAAAQPRGSQAPASIFSFDADGFWLNLHSFLYVLGRAEAGLADRTRLAVTRAPSEAAATLERAATDEVARWRAAVATYAGGRSRLDAVFDAPLIRSMRALADLAEGSEPASDAIDGPHREALRAVAPVYRRLFWPDHQRGNREWVARLEPLLARHGQEILGLVTKAYGGTWPSGGYPVRVSAYSNWAGAYSTQDRSHPDDGRLLVVSSRAGLQNAEALEIVFHEAMHQWDGAIQPALADAARGLGRRAPPGLSHAMIFYTAGAAVRRVVPGHVPYAEAHGLWRGPMSQFLPALQKAWQPWLDGATTRESALTELIHLLTWGSGTIARDELPSVPRGHDDRAARRASGPGGRH